MTETKQFAFGENERNGCKCPAMVAGFEPGMADDNSLTPAELYDDNVRTSEGTSFGIIEEEVAKEAWLNALDKIERFGYDGEEVAREVADELGWEYE